MTPSVVRLLGPPPHPPGLVMPRRSTTAISGVELRRLPMSSLLRRPDTRHSTARIGPERISLTCPDNRVRVLIRPRRGRCAPTRRGRAEERREAILGVQGRVRRGRGQCAGLSSCSGSSAWRRLSQRLDCTRASARGRRQDRGGRARSGSTAPNWGGGQMRLQVRDVGLWLRGEAGQRSSTAEPVLGGRHPVALQVREAPGRRPRPRRCRWCADLLRVAVGWRRPATEGVGSGRSEPGPAPRPSSRPERRRTVWAR